jgi:hypothetical protein
MSQAYGPPQPLAGIFLLYLKIFDNNIGCIFFSLKNAVRG